MVALIWASDAHHAAATRAWQGILDERAELVTTDLVVAEAVTLTRARATFDLSVAVAERILAEPFQVRWIDAKLMADAVRLYRKYSDHALSLCDCASFAVMRAERIKVAFTYDADFEAVGFARA